MTQDNIHLTKMMLIAKELGIEDDFYSFDNSYIDTFNFETIHKDDLKNTSKVKVKEIIQKTANIKPDSDETFKINIWIKTNNKIDKRFKRILLINPAIFHNFIYAEYDNNFNKWLKDIRAFGFQSMLQLIDYGKENGWEKRVIFTSAINLMTGSNKHIEEWFKNGLVYKNEIITVNYISSIANTLAQHSEYCRSKIMSEKFFDDIFDLITIDNFPGGIATNVSLMNEECVC